jgi:ATP-dependent Lon protease
MPGKLVQDLARMRELNGVIMLDELDKAKEPIHGALHEILDPEQNHNFVDNYIGHGIDASKITFIATANDLEKIPPSLNSRIRVIEMSGYTEQEKLQVAKIFLIPKAMKKLGIDVRIEDEAIKTIIRRYTNESGVRELNREIYPDRRSNECRKEKF